MDLEALSNWSLGESERLEFKEATGELRSAIATLCACSTAPVVRFYSA